MVADVSINGTFLERFRGDGITVSTPTGSTAYNKSIGGAVLHPTVEAFQMTEIASLNNRVYRTLGSSAIIPKGDTRTVEKIRAAVENAKKESLSKWGGKIPPNLKLPLRDGDIERPDDEAYAGSYFLNANSRQAPQVVDRKVQPILDQSEVYSGCYGQISVTFYGFNTNGNRGIAAGLGNIQKLRDGEPLGGRVNAEEEFETYDDDDFLS